MNQNRYPIDHPYFVARETYVIELTSASGTTAVSIGDALKSGYRRSVVAAELTNEDVGARCQIEFYDGTSGTRRGYVAAEDNQAGFSGVRIDGAGAAAGPNTVGQTVTTRPTYKLNAAIVGSGRAILVLECVIEAVREAPPTYLA